MMQYIVLLVTYVLGYALSKNYGFLSFALLLGVGIFAYFYYANKEEMNYFKAKAVFSAVWLTTIGLAQLRLLEYQGNWQMFTWVNMAAGHIAFILANDLAAKYFPVIDEKYSLKKIIGSKSSFQYGFVSDRLFWVVVVTSVIGIASFIASVIIKGYIPLFVINQYPSAYLDFYTKFHMFTVAGMLSGGLAYYCLKRLQLTRTKKVILWMIIFVMVFALPILLVQRGTFMTNALVLAVTVYSLSNRKFYIAILCIVMIFSIYMFGSSLRGYSDTQLNEFFQPKDIELSDGEGLDIGGLDFGGGELKTRFKIPSKVAFLYSYLTVSHDNFNLLLDEKKENTWGIWQLQPFNVILRLDRIAERIDEAEKVLENYRVLPHLNTYNLIAFAFYDFGLPGVLFFVFLWSFGFGMVEAFNRKYRGPYGILAYGVTLTPIALCFFYPWMSFFSIWMLWGTILLMFLASTITMKRKEGKTI